ncbi:MAG: recombinase family protein [Bacteroidia bacterium]|nr:recombinase family protein [Bacteroidia bacterium]
MSAPKFLQAFAKAAAATAPQSAGNCVIYTRVSTKEQADTNMSLNTQLKACDDFAQKNGLTVLGHFGGTYESAKSDERKEFKRMLDFVKRSKRKVSTIVVYSVDRFSRSGPNAIYITHELRQQGILVQSVSQPIDAATPTGSFQQNIQFLFSEYDNQLRREKCIAGTRDKLLRGEWVTRPPLGYDMIVQNGRQLIQINAQGRILQKAFYWKAHEGTPNVEIVRRLKLLGLPLTKEGLRRTFKNVFYCGYLSHRCLGGSVVKGNHAPLVPVEVFQRVNEVTTETHRQGWRHTAEPDLYPLRVFAKEARTGSSFAGYEVKRKRLHYYKAGSGANALNLRMETAHARFAELLEQYTLQPRFVAPLKAMLPEVVAELTHAQAEDHRSQQLRLKELTRKLNRLEERFIEEQVPLALYEKFRASYTAEIGQLKAELEPHADVLSNLPEALAKALEIAQDMVTTWVSAPFAAQRSLQYLVFPEGVTYDRETGHFRTSRVNALFSAIRSLSSSCEGPKRKQRDPKAALPHWVRVALFKL